MLRSFVGVSKYTAFLLIKRKIHAHTLTLPKNPTDLGIDPWLYLDREMPQYWATSGLAIWHTTLIAVKCKSNRHSNYLFISFVSIQLLIKRIFVKSLFDYCSIELHFSLGWCLCCMLFHPEPTICFSLLYCCISRLKRQKITQWSFYLLAALRPKLGANLFSTESFICPNCWLELHPNTP